MKWSVIWVLMVGASATVAAEDAHVLLVGSRPDHPYASHMYEFECRLLATCLAKNDGVTAEYVATHQLSELVSILVL